MRTTPMGNRLRVPALFLLLGILASCGGGGYDEEGLASGDSEEQLFLRASQQYFRGSLTTSRNGFNAIASSCPDSPLADDALMASRMIERELGGLPDTVETVEVVETDPFPPLALVGKPSTSTEMGRLVDLLNAQGCIPVSIEDQGAPGMTLVLYPEGSQAEAQRVADSLSSWLSSPPSVGIQPGDNVIPAVAPGHQGIVVVVGTDAFVDRSIQSRPGQITVP